MDAQDSAGTVRLSDPRALRAYAHPIRLALMALLRREGPKTATQAAQVLDESVPSCSFHLRQLAKYGLVEQAGGGRGREKPWRATAMFTDWDAAGLDDPAAADAAQALDLALAKQYFELAARWVRARPSEPAVWQEAAQSGDIMLHLTAGELQDLAGRMQDLLQPYIGRSTDSASRPAGTRPVVLVHLAIPVPAAGESGDPPRSALPCGED
jgi:predicted transcriptional regulator